MKTIFKAITVGAALMTTVTACAVAQDDTIEFLAFGDSGYHLEYQKAKVHKNPVKTKEAYIAGFTEKYAEKNFPLDRLPPPPLEYSAAMGGYVMESGMTAVASGMKQYCTVEKCNFAVMLGDNIYPDGATLGTDGKDDATRFQDMFVEPFGDLGAAVKDFAIYVALGNHDWHTSREGALAQVDFMEKTRPFYMDGLFYTVKPPAGKGDVELFIVDTEVLLSSTTVYDARLDENGHPVSHTEVDDRDPWTVPATEAERNMAAWLEQSLKNSTAKWKFVIAHHPIWASAGSKFEQGKALAKLILPSMCKYADGYFVGHEHTLEVHTDNCQTALGTVAELPLPQILSGAASKQRPINPNFKAYQDKNNPQNEALWVQDMIYGFSHITLQGDMMTVKMMTTPNDGSYAPVEAFRHTFKRRSHLMSDKK
ncbi:metallophosphoesterase [Paremcibacter congregatus]|uniref:Calcineurin-like phosphoesterase domain-containing protein n=1 Tax=Paremcibacter congregatus TaxID=2043170 RepID=A0A2G4YWB4_9PROT|nr:metallophosphoesterase [Paremcibacter congregatus]PHZ86540.1 hypothetical protein CRD36_01265 [Paremcibacter congregatus]QDE26344.1 hypothetical protein FIV45_03135 [Paremcibacter congregatus]